jgi:hypothetical protein
MNDHSKLGSPFVIVVHETVEANSRPRRYKLIFYKASLGTAKTPKSAWIFKDKLSRGW